MDNDIGSTSYAIPYYVDYTVEAPTMPSLYNMTMAEINAWASALELPEGYQLIPYFIYEDGTPVDSDTATCIGQSISEGTYLDTDFLDTNGQGITITMPKPVEVLPETTTPEV